MTNAVSMSPTHKRKEVKRFANMCKSNHDQESCAKYL
jgi:hypothetical protein